MTSAAAVVGVGAGAGIAMGSAVDLVISAPGDGFASATLQAACKTLCKLFRTWLELVLVLVLVLLEPPEE